MVQVKEVFRYMFASELEGGVGVASGWMQYELSVQR